MPNVQSTPAKRLIILGSTGSIGVNALKVVEHLRTQSLFEFEVVGLAAGANAEMLAKQAKKFKVNNIALANSDRANLIHGFQSTITGSDSALELIDQIAKPGDLVLGAMVGSAGIPATLAAIERGCDIALANKETLVAAGALVMPLIQKTGVNLIPIDSEHSALFQCMQAGRSIDEVKRVVITASGGPFRTWSKEQVANATVDDALNHPTWNMGPKVTIDSASMMNKALEVIEAHWLFGLSADQIDVIVHPQSLIHSFVEFVDGSVIAQLGPPDMKTPIQYAMTWPYRMSGCSTMMNWNELSRMDFEQVDCEMFPAPSIAKDVIQAEGTAGAIFNAANEAAVQAFLTKQIPFGQIIPLVRDAMDTISVTPVQLLDDVLNADQNAREVVESSISSFVAV